MQQRALQRVGKSPVRRRRLTASERSERAVLRSVRYWQRQLALYVEYQFKRRSLQHGLSARLTAVLTLVVLVLSPAGFMDWTRAYFSDAEATTGNVLQSDSLEFSATPQGPTAVTITPTSTAALAVDVAQVGNLGFQYTAAASNLVGPLCAQLNLMAELDGAGVYNSTLTGFTSGPHVFASPEAWDFELTLGGSATMGTTCDFDVTYQGWQLDQPSFSTLYFTDEHTVHFTVTAGSDIVLNEIMWMGSKYAPANDAKDEWIELRNLSPFPVDVSGWVVENAATSSGNLTLPEDSVVPGNGYLLIANYSQSDSAMDVPPDWVTTAVAFNNTYSSNGRVRLWNTGGDLVDSTPSAGSSAWPAGKNETYKKWSMERNIVPGDGTATSSWHTCDPTIMTPEDLATMQSYWDEAAQPKVCGTPKHANLSRNDPTAPDYDPSLGEDEPVQRDAPPEEGEECGMLNAECSEGDGTRDVITPPEPTELLPPDAALEGTETTDAAEVTPETDLPPTVEPPLTEETAPEPIEEPAPVEEPVVEETPAEPAAEETPVDEPVDTDLADGRLELGAGDESEAAQPDESAAAPAPVVESVPEPTPEAGA